MADARPGASGADGSVALLSAMVRRYLERALPEPGPMPREIRITQTGQMWRTPGARAMAFSASQRIAVERVAFWWRARFPILALVGLDVRDEYADGVGSLRARLLGIPVIRQTGRETTLGEALRYLAELPWAPQAMAANRQLEWHQVDERSVEVATGVGSERVAVVMEFDAAGDVVRTSCQERPRSVGRAWTATPWGGDFRDYATLGGMRLPTRAEVWWELPEGRLVYWRARVTSAAAVGELGRG